MTSTAASADDPSLKSSSPDRIESYIEHHPPRTFTVQTDFATAGRLSTRFPRTLHEWSRTRSAHWNQLLHRSPNFPVAAHGLNKSRRRSSAQINRRSGPAELHTVAYAFTAERPDIIDWVLSQQALTATGEEDPIIRTVILPVHRYHPGVWLLSLQTIKPIDLASASETAEPESGERDAHVDLDSNLKPGEFLQHPLQRLLLTCSRRFHLLDWLHLLEPRSLTRDSNADLPGIERSCL